MIVDSHCHAWTTWPYDTSVPDPHHRGTIERLLFEMDKEGVDKAVLICARIDHNPDDNDYVFEASKRWPDRIVQFPDIDSGWSPEYHTPGAVDRLQAAIDRWGIAGFTHYVNEHNDGWLLSDEGMAFFARAAEADLVASIAANGDWWADLRQVARAFPTLPILIHHQGMARAVDGPDSATLREVLACAAEPNIAVKASGFYYGSKDWAEYPYPEQRAIFRRIAEAFGPKRLAWGSDYPVSPWVACTFRQTLDVVRVHCADFLSPEDLAWVMGDTMETLLRTRRPVAG
ncbi:MAG: amidohydrolase family protein [Chloroflexota bacterium]